LLQPHARERTRRGAALSAFVVLLVVLVAPLGRASGPPLVSDSVRVWNAHALAALFNAPTATVPGAGQTPPVGAQHMAMTQLAVYDAVNSIHGGYEPYLDGLPSAAPSSSLDAAVATAAHHVLVGLGIAPVPALPQVVRDRLDGLYTDALAAIPDGVAKNGGIAAGAAAAAEMLAERTGDGRYVPDPFTEGLGAGEWRPTSGVNDPFAWVRNVDPFTLESPSQFRTKGPLDLDSKAYAKEYDEVKALGSMTNSSRTQDQTDLALFYTANPVEMFNRAFRDVTVGEGLGIVDEARFYAQVNVSGADALINCGDDKEHWHFWRPITAIQNGDDDTNPRTVGDPDWTSLVAAPPYPDHPSGYNCLTGAFMNTAQAFLGKKADLRITNLASGVTREYKRFLDVVDDTIDARMYLGIHFRTPDVQGARLGKDVARWVDRHYFKRAK
jgi:vanadium-dependent haloperoxidase-like protein